MFAKGHDDDLAGFEDRADPHGQGLLGHVLFPEEVARRVAARHGIERRQARAAMACRARLVEADMSGSADAQNLQVDAAGTLDHLFIFRAVASRVLSIDQAVRDVDILRLDVDVIEKRFLHPAPVTVRIVGVQAQVFVEIKRDHAGEIDARLFMEPEQLAVNADRGRPGRQTQNRSLARGIILADQAFNHQRHVARRLRTRGQDQGWNARVRNILGRHVFGPSSVARRLCGELRHWGHCGEALDQE